MINYHETYQSLSTAELLNIVKQANDYQPEAVLTAIALLKTKTITPEDELEADRLMTAIKANRIDVKPYLNKLYDNAEKLVEPIVHPETTVDPKKWMNILMVTLGIYSVWSLVRLIERWRRLYEFDRLTYFSVFELYEPLYLLVSIIGIYKRKKWGWFLLMVFCIQYMLTFGHTVIISIQSPYLRSLVAPEIASVLLAFGIIFLLSRSYTKDYFNIGSKTFRNSFFTGIIFFLLIEVLVKYFY